jgi:hypothetical protein
MRHFRHAGSGSTSAAPCRCCNGSFRGPSTDGWGVEQKGSLYAILGKPKKTEVTPK